MKRSLAAVVLMSGVLPSHAATLNAVAVLAPARPEGIPVWVWPIVGVLALAWIKVLLPEDLFRRNRAGTPEPPLDHVATAAPVLRTPTASADALHPPAALRSMPGWSVELIRGLTLNRLEMLVHRYWRMRGCEVHRGHAADGSIQLLISRPATGKLFALAQCAPVAGEATGLDAVRALAVAGTHKASGIVVLYSMSGFTDEALGFAKGQPVKLIDAAGLLSEIQQLAPMQQQRLLEQTLITSGPVLARG